MRFVGQHYLDETLRPSIERIVAERKPCEIDPTRVKDKGSIHQNLFNLKVSTYRGYTLCFSFLSGCFNYFRVVAELRGRYF